MATAAAAIDQAAPPKPVDGSLWWDSFVPLFDDLDAASASGDVPASLEKKIRGNHRWFVESVFGFKQPNEASRTALDSARISVGGREMRIEEKLKDVALGVSAALNLDEVQSYILVQRNAEVQKTDVAVGDVDSFHVILVHYYLERQCLLKSIRRMFLHAFYAEKASEGADVIENEALQLVHDGLEEKLFWVLEGLHHVSFFEKSEVDIATLWVEESLFEDSLALDILFLVYYEDYISCSSKHWMRLSELFKKICSGSLNIVKLAVTTEAGSSLYYIKVQLLLILIETLDLEGLLGGVYNQVSFRDGGFVFSTTDVQEIDAIISTFMGLEYVEAAPLVLSWAVFLCLLQSLPDRQDHDNDMEYDHVRYLHQAMHVGPFDYLSEVLHSDFLKNSDGPGSGFLSVLRTFISSFISAYEIRYQSEDNILSLLLNIICQIYRGEETLCMQFWDRDSFIDGPIRSLLGMLESEFPFHLVDFIRLLSSLSRGSWPAECVYNFLDNLSGVTLPFEISNALQSVHVYEVIEIDHPLHIPGVEGLVVPGKTLGQVLRVIDENTILVRWQHAHSGVLLLLLLLAQEFHLIKFEELDHILELLFGMVRFNKVLCFTLLDNDNSSLAVKLVSGHIEKTARVDIVKILGTLISKLFEDVKNAGRVSICINILGEMLKCSPSRVSDATHGTYFFGLCSRDLSCEMDSWFLSRGLAQTLLADCEENVDCTLTISVLDYTLQLIDVGFENELVSALVVFSLEYVLVNHENWKYQSKYARWKVTLKVLEVLKKCIPMMRSASKYGMVIHNILFGDSSVHGVLFRILCIRSDTLESLYVNRLFDVKEVEGLQLALSSAIDILQCLLMEACKLEEVSSDPPIFVQKVLSSNIRPIPLFAAAMSLISFFRDSVIQAAASRLLSTLLLVASKAKANSFEKFSLATNDMEVKELVMSVMLILDDDVNQDEDLIIAVLNLLTCAARYQPSFFVNIISMGQNIEVSPCITGDASGDLIATPAMTSFDPKRGLIGSVLRYVSRSGFLIESAPRILLCIIGFFKVLWEAGFQYIQILDAIRNSEMVWKQFVSLIPTSEANIKDQDGDELQCSVYRYQCQAAVLEILGHDVFLVGKMSQESTSKTTGNANKSSQTTSLPGTCKGAKDVISTWCEGSVVEFLVKNYFSCEYDSQIVYRAKIAISLCLVHLVVRLLSGDEGSLSVSLISKIRLIVNKLSNHPAFCTLLAQYKLRGYSKEEELSALVFSDLYHHLLGELEGREISTGSFKELLQYILDLGLFQDDIDHIPDLGFLDNGTCMFDISRMHAELRVSFWEYSNWKESRSIVDGAFQHMHEANSIVLLSDSKLSALRALIMLLTLSEGNIIQRNLATIGGMIPDRALQSTISYICPHLRDAFCSPTLSLHPPKHILKFHVAQIELLGFLTRSLIRRDSAKKNWRALFPVHIHVLRTSAVALKLFIGNWFTAIVPKNAMEIFFGLLLSSIESTYPVKDLVDKSSAEVDMIGEVSVITLGLLPILCRYAEHPDYCNLSIACVDLILRNYGSPTAWLPVLQKHLNLPCIIHRLRENDNVVPVQVILKFLLTLSQKTGGAQLLLSAGCLPSLKAFLDLLIHKKSCPDDIDGNALLRMSDGFDPVDQTWGLALAIFVSIIFCLDDHSTSSETAESVISYIFSEKIFMIYRTLSNLKFSSDEPRKKTQKIPRQQISLSSLREIEHTIELICTLAKHRTSWLFGTKGNISELREACIHMLAFISKGLLHAGDSTDRAAGFSCPPVDKEELAANERPPFVGSKKHWFVLSSVGSGLKDRAVKNTPGTSLSLVPKDNPNGISDCIQQSKFSDMVAVHVYRITFLLLRFLCMEATAAAQRAVEVRLINLAHFPELPIPEILHGIQDQAITIVTEICGSIGSKSIQQEPRFVCFLLMGLLEMSLYLELCVLQSCGITPVLGRIEDFSKEVKIFLRVTEEHTCFKAPLKSLQQVIDLIYPGLMRGDIIF